MNNWYKVLRGCLKTSPIEDRLCFKVCKCVCAHIFSEPFTGCWRKLGLSYCVCHIRLLARSLAIVHPLSMCVCTPQTDIYTVCASQFLSRLYLWVNASYVCVCLNMRRPRFGSACSPCASLSIAWRYGLEFRDTARGSPFFMRKIRPANNTTPLLFQNFSTSSQTPTAAFDWQ